MGKEIVSYKSRIGQDFPGFKVVGHFISEATPKKRGTHKYLCWCSCGREFSVRCADIGRGVVKSCGCRQYTTKHNMSLSPEYKAWGGAKHRCSNKNNRSFKNYGGRGVKVCDRWKNSFKFFIKDMGVRPSKSHSLDRINNNGDYEPSNCRWATTSQQALNKRFPSAPKTEVTCCTCAKKFLILSSLVSAKKKHWCADSCRPKGGELPCAHCGNMFYEIRSRLGKTKFCGKECYFNSRYPGRKNKPKLEV